MNYFTDFQISQILLNEPNLIRDAVFEAFTEHGEGNVRQSKNSLRKNENSPSSDRLTSMMGFVGRPTRVVGFKLIGSFSKNPLVGLPRASVLIVLCDPETHAPLQILDGTSISLQRTAETAILGVELLHPDARKIAVIGNGNLAHSIIHCIRKRLINLQETLVYGREELKKLGTSKSIPADVVITATNADFPILNDPHLKLVNLVINLGLREISSSTIAALDEHIVDDLISCAHQTTPFAEALHTKSILQNEVYQLSDILKSPFTTKSRGRIYFQPSGMVAIDLLAGAKVVGLLI